MIFPQIEISSRVVDHKEIKEYARVFLHFYRAAFLGGSTWPHYPLAPIPCSINTITLFRLLAQKYTYFQETG